MVYKVCSKVMHRMHTVISGHAFKSLDNSAQVYRMAAYTHRERLDHVKIPKETYDSDAHLV